MKKVFVNVDFNETQRKKLEAVSNDYEFIYDCNGDIYDSEVLYEVLSNKIIKAAAADVFEVEPLPQESKLYDLDNFVVTPHVAGFFHLDSAKQEYCDLICENLRRYANNEELKYVVSQREN